MKRVVIALCVVLVVAGGVGVYVWTALTALPDWYTEGDENPDPGGHDVEDSREPLRWVPVTDGEEVDELPSENTGPEPAAAPQTQPPQAAPQPKGAAPSVGKTKRRRKRAKRHELRGFHRRSAKKRKGTVKASRAVLEDGQLEAGVVLDLSKLPRDKLSTRDKQLFDKAVKNFPGLSKRDVYVGIEDTPVTKDGVLQLGPNPKVRVGNLRYSLPKAAGKLGMSEQQLRTEFNRELRRMGLTDPNAEPR